MRHLLLISFLITITYTIKTISLGFLFPLTSEMLYNISGYNLSAGGVSVAIEKIIKEEILQGYNFSYHVRFDECDTTKVVGMTEELIKEDNVDVIFGSTCSVTATKSSLHSMFYDKPTFTWGISANSDYTNTNRLPNLITINPLISPIIIALIDMLKTFNWTSVAFLSTTNTLGRCRNIRKGIESAIELDTSELSIVESYETSIPPSKDDYDKFLRNIKENSRIVISCFDSDYWRRQFYIKMFDQKMNNGEYVLINFENRNSNFLQNTVNKTTMARLLSYEDDNIPNDGRDKDAFEMAQYSLFLDLAETQQVELEFLEDIVTKIKEYPFYCNDCNHNNATLPSIFATYLLDSIYLWSKILNKTIGIYGESAIYNGSLYRKYCEGNYSGVVDSFSYDNNCFRLADIELTGLDENGNRNHYIRYKFSNLSSYTKSSYDLNNLRTTLFKKWDNIIPLNVPKCGYMNNKCSNNFIENNKAGFIVICIVCGILIILSVGGLVYAMLLFKKHKKDEMSKWNIPYSFIEKYNPKGSINQSMVSFQSGYTSKSSKESFRNKMESRKYMYGFYQEIPIVGSKYSSGYLINVKEIEKEINIILGFEHKNINKFYGLCTEVGNVMSIWRYNKRGSLFDFLQSDNSVVDTFFCNNMLTDILEGLNYIHNSPIKFHGMFSSKKCLVSDQWQLKVSDFDSKSMRNKEKISNIDKLWIAPEMLRSENYIGSQEGDIYALAIIASEVFTKNVPWNFTNRSESLDEIIYLVKKGGENPFRPELCIAQGLQIEAAALELCRVCWNEDIDKRPKVKFVIDHHKGFSQTKAKNLMDHVFFTLEDNAQLLKNEVDARSKEVLEEQKKSDILLRKMLPPQVAEKLKLGLSVPPVDYDNVTVFFSDIVKFTGLAQKCSPLQVVNLLNDLFSQFDNIIESRDVYKVETTGDGYLCVSGLPQRNGNNHVVEIAHLALGFMQTCHEYKIPHLYNEKINLRIGCNTGPCTAGVVGLSMPRYCLFGDTVNTASRMESNGKPGKIHTTESFYGLLKSIGGFIMEHRGEVIIKGKGVMDTYWLNGVKDGYTLNEY
uniref:Guanylate cyclase n=1 Tax=Parastrongyloides trichosuri TaxID=131310 RepID=A0A0N4Z932_PARTI